LYAQAAVIHQSIFKFLHIDDQDIVKLKLAWPFDMTKDNKVSFNRFSSPTLSLLLSQIRTFQKFGVSSIIVDDLQMIFYFVLYVAYAQQAYSILDRILIVVRAETRKNVIH